MMNDHNMRAGVRDMLAAQNEPKNLRTLVEIFWRLLLFSVLLGIFAVIGYGSWEFFGVTGNANSSDAAGSRLHTALSRTQLDAVISDFQSRAQVFQSLQMNFTPVPDPSK